jgi:hypothetical protein
MPVATTRLDQFRLFYNHTIQPELMRLERVRLRLVVFAALSVLFMAAMFAMSFYLNILAVTLILSFPAGVAFVYLVYKLDEFRRNFKPRVVRLILDFIDDGPNFDDNNPLMYHAARFIPKEGFFASRIFDTPAHVYKGEDLVEGKVGEMYFELCELRVGEISVVLNRINSVFHGVFLHAIFNEPTIGDIMVWPRSRLQFLTNSIRAFTFEGGKNKDDEILNEGFRQTFMTYATEDTHVAGILSPPMQEALLEYTIATKKDIFIAFHNKDIYLALSEEKDLLEPFLFKSNLSFDRIREFFEDIHSLLHLVEVFDQTH